jgi:hypothetical protein
MPRLGKAMLAPPFSHRAAEPTIIIKMIIDTSSNKTKTNLDILDYIRDSQNGLDMSEKCLTILQKDLQSTLPLTSTGYG